MGQLVTRNCPICNTEYLADLTRLKHGRQTTCSRDCSYHYRADLQKSSAELSCPICGTSFIRPPSQLAKRGPSFCSLKCRGKGQTIGLTRRKKPSYTEDSKERQRANGRIQIAKALAKLKADDYASLKTPERRKTSSEMMIARIREGKINRRSKLEILVQEKLEEYQIEYIPQYTIRDDRGRYVACLDFYIPNSKLALEVNGTYWHADPRFFDSERLSTSQKRTLEFYNRKLKLLSILDIRLQELWEYDIKNNLIDYEEMFRNLIHHTGF